MILTFCGHAQFIKTEEYENRILSLLEEIIGFDPAEIYLGGYGGFDNFVYECCRKYKQTHPNISLVFVTPYVTLEYQKNHLDDQKRMYDYIIYPEIEDKPKRYAISYRNKYMVEKSDCVIAYVLHKWGGAYSTYTYAKRKGKTVLNIAEFDE